MPFKSQNTQAYFLIRTRPPFVVVDLVEAPFPLVLGFVTVKPLTEVALVDFFPAVVPLGFLLTEPFEVAVCHK